MCVIIITNEHEKFLNENYFLDHFFNNKATTYQQLQPKLLRQ